MTFRFRFGPSNLLLTIPMQYFYCGFKCYMLLCLCVYEIQQYRHLNNSCPLSFRFRSVCNLKVGKSRCYCCFQLASLNGHLFGKELLFGLLRVSFLNILSICVCAAFRFGFEDWMWDLVVLIPDHCLSIYFKY